jgi:hypothetical protein
MDMGHGQEAACWRAPLDALPEAPAEGPRELTA